MSLEVLIDDMSSDTSSDRLVMITDESVRNSSPRITFLFHMHQRRASTISRIEPHSDTRSQISVFFASEPWTHRTVRGSDPP
jgi:hypothetical protein